eukprot:Ihof_evm5s282 gene=Ihof_evmTU5s282
MSGKGVSHKNLLGWLKYAAILCTGVVFYMSRSISFGNGYYSQTGDLVENESENMNKESVTMVVVTDELQPMKDNGIIVNISKSVEGVNIIRGKVGEDRKDIYIKNHLKIDGANATMVNNDAKNRDWVNNFKEYKTELELDNKKNKDNRVYDSTIKNTIFEIDIRQNIEIGQNIMPTRKEDKFTNPQESEEIKEKAHINETIKMKNVYEYPFVVQKEFVKMKGDIKSMKILGESKYYCENGTCVVENVCVDHAK